MNFLPTNGKNSSLELLEIKQSVRVRHKHNATAYVYMCRVTKLGVKSFRISELHVTRSGQF